jgi:C4-dicarboxylate-specific signal transduction histidine kinase
MTEHEATGVERAATADDLFAAQLRYIGHMTAVLTHELRNDLATINEKSGLIGDMVAMTARGRPLDEQRVGRIASDVARRVAEATTVCERLSRLAHAPDAALHTLELGALVALIATVLARPARVTKVTFELVPSTPVNVEAPPVLLHYVIYRCLLAAAEGLPGRAIEVAAAGEVRGTASVRFAGAGARLIAEQVDGIFARALAELGAELRAHDDDTAFLRVPTVRRAVRDEGASAAAQKGV